jgi:uncharacterized protein YqgC (DUF456 family)
MEPTTIVVITWILIIIGLAGTIIPGLPGVGLVFGGILLYALYFGVDTVGLMTLILLGVVTAFTFIIDLLAGIYGAKRFGATKAGIIGSAVGGILGLMILSLPGLFLGVFLGAIAGEHFFAKKNLEEAMKAGYGSILGFLGGTIIKLILAIIMVLVFAFRVWF